MPVPGGRGSSSAASCVAPGVAVLDPDQPHRGKAARPVEVQEPEVLLVLLPKRSNRVRVPWRLGVSGPEARKPLDGDELVDGDDRRHPGSWGRSDWAMSRRFHCRFALATVCVPQRGNVIVAEAALSSRRLGGAFRRRRGYPFRGGIRALRGIHPVRRLFPGAFLGPADLASGPAVAAVTAVAVAGHRGERHRDRRLRGVAHGWPAARAGPASNGIGRRARRGELRPGVRADRRLRGAAVAAVPRGPANAAPRGCRQHGGAGRDSGAGDRGDNRGDDTRLGRPEGPAGMASGSSGSSGSAMSGQSSGTSAAADAAMGDMGTTDGQPDMKMYGTTAPPTAAQVTAAARLISETDASLKRYANVQAAFASGYTYVLKTNGEEHLLYDGPNPSYQGLNPQDPSSLVYAIDVPHHAPILLGAMYIMGDDQRSGPQVGGGLTRWHSHLVTCVDGRQIIAGFNLALRDGCNPATWQDRYTAQMLHVWVVPIRRGVLRRPERGRDQRRGAGRAGTLSCSTASQSSGTSGSLREHSACSSGTATSSTGRAGRPWTARAGCGRGTCPSARPARGPRRRHGTGWTPAGRPPRQRRRTCRRAPGGPT